MADHFYFPFEKKASFVYTPESVNKLTGYQKYQLSFHPERPKYLDYLTIFDHVQECLRTDAYGACLIQTHRAEFKGMKLMLIGQQSGPSSKYNAIRKSMADPETMKQWNHGMATPESYKRAAAGVKLANQENRMVVTFLDTPGADPTENAEAGGIAWRIGNTIQAVADAQRPTIAIIINRGCSGGAIALSGCDVVLAMEYSSYLVISPEAASSILFHSRTEANRAAEAMWITSKEGKKVGIVDELIPESPGPAHQFPDAAKQALGLALGKQLRQMDQVKDEDVFEKRIKRWTKMGAWSLATAKELASFTAVKSRIPKPQPSGYIKRHDNCRTVNGKRIYDLQNFNDLLKNDFVCPECRKHYVRLSAWDYIHFALDKDSFVEHAETKFLVDKDILGFPDYPEKLQETRSNTGLAAAMITGDGTIQGQPVVYCGTDFGFLGGSFCMSSAEKIWRASKIAIAKKLPIILQASGGGARMHEGCSSMVGIPKAHVALTRVERAGLKVITLITDPTLGGVAIGYAARGIQLFEEYAGNIGFSGKRVIEQYTGHKTSRDFQTTEWLQDHGHVKKTFKLKTLRQTLADLIKK